MFLYSIYANYRRHIIGYLITCNYQQIWTDNSYMICA